MRGFIHLYLGFVQVLYPLHVAYIKRREVVWLSVSAKKHIFFWKVAFLYDALQEHDGGVLFECVCVYVCVCVCVCVCV